MTGFKFILVKSFSMLLKYIGLLMLKKHLMKVVMKVLKNIGKSLNSNLLALLCLFVRNCQNWLRFQLMHLLSLMCMQRMQYKIQLIPIFQISMLSNGFLNSVITGIRMIRMLIKCGASVLQLSSPMVMSILVTQVDLLLHHSQISAI